MLFRLFSTTSPLSGHRNGNLVRSLAVATCKCTRCDHCIGSDGSIRTFLNANLRRSFPKNCHVAPSGAAQISSTDEQLVNSFALDT